MLDDPPGEDVRFCRGHETAVPRPGNVGERGMNAGIHGVFPPADCAETLAVVLEGTRCQFAAEQPLEGFE